MHHLHQHYDVLVFISTKEVMCLLAVVCLFVCDGVEENYESELEQRKQ